MDNLFAKQPARFSRFTRAIAGQIKCLRRLVLSAAFLVIPCFAAAAPETGTGAEQMTQVIHFGVQTTEGTTRALESFKPLIEMLNQTAISQNSPFRFTILPYSTSDIRLKSQSGEIDIMFVDPATFVWAEVNALARPLLSSATMWNGATIEQNGAVVFTRSDRVDIRRIADLKGQRLMAVETDSFGGWLLIKNELMIRNFRPAEFLSGLLFGNGNQRDVVYAVQNRLVDAGVVRSGVLESLAKDGIIDLADFAAISAKLDPEFPFLSSTSRQPGWALAAMPDVPEDALTIVVESLLRTSPNSLEAKSAGNIVWQAPQNYQPVHRLLIYMRVAPYEHYFWQAILRIYQNYRIWILLGLTLTLMSLGFLGYELRRNLVLIEEGRDVLASEVRSKGFYRNAVEEHTVFCMLSKDGMISHVNQQFCSITEYNQAELMERTLSSLLSEGQQQQLKHEIADTLQTGAPWKGTLRLIKSDGSQAWTQCTIIPITKSDKSLSEIAIVASDVTQTCNGISTDRFHDSLELISDQVIVMRPNNLEVLHCNKAAVDRFVPKKFKDKWAGKRLKLFVNAEEFRTFELRRDALVEGPDRRITWEVETDDGSPFDISLEYVQPENDEPRLVAIYRDISERRAAERAKNEFVSTISHELRTPLTSMKGALGLVLSGSVGETSGQVDKLINMANTNCNRLVMLINDILDLEKIDAGKMEYAMKPIDVVELVANAVESNQFYADKFEVKIKSVIGEDPNGYIVHADVNRMTQVMDNLLSNAAKFSEKGGEIIVSLLTDGNKVRLSIRDFGSGIPKQAQAKIFDKFTQGDSSDTRSTGGTGLGLAIVKMIVEVHKGSVKFTSEEGVGTEFFVDLPRLIDGKPVTADQIANSNFSITAPPAKTMIDDAEEAMGMTGQVQRIVKNLRNNRIVADLNKGHVMAQQIVNGHGSIGQTNILNWVSSDAKKAVAALMDAGLLGNQEVYAISSTAPADLEDDDQSIVSVESDVLTSWLADLAGPSGQKIKILGMGDQTMLNASHLKYTQVENVEQCIVQAEQNGCDLITHFSYIGDVCKLIVIPVSTGILSDKIPVIVLETRRDDPDTERGVVAKFARPSSAGRGKSRRQMAS